MPQHPARLGKTRGSPFSRVASEHWREQQVDEMNDLRCYGPFPASVDREMRALSFTASQQIAMTVRRASWKHEWIFAGPQREDC